MSPFIGCALILMLLTLGLTPALGLAPPNLPDMPTATAQPGWSKQGSSLLLYGAEGGLLDEIGLSREETATATRETRGGVSPDRRAAWTLERRLLWTPGRGKLLESRRSLRVYGSSTRPLWSDDAADWPERGDPVAFSQDSMVALVARRLGEAWSVEAREWMGGLILKAGPFPRLDSIGLASGGRFAMMRWSVTDKSDTHTFLDLKAKTRKDIESSELTLGLARFGDDGVVRSGRRDVMNFELEPAAVSTTSIPAPPAGEK